MFGFANFLLLALFAADEVYSSANPNTGAGITSIESGALEEVPALEAPLEMEAILP